MCVHIFFGMGGGDLGRDTYMGERGQYDEGN